MDKYFILFNDDYTRSIYLYFLYDKAKALDVLKVFKIKVKKLKKKKIKVARLYRDREYYERYTKKGQMAGPFAKFLKEKSIAAQCTMPRIPQ